MDGLAEEEGSIEDSFSELCFEEEGSSFEVVLSLEEEAGALEVASFEELEEGAGSWLEGTCEEELAGVPPQEARERINRLRISDGEKRFMTTILFPLRAREKKELSKVNRAYAPEFEGTSLKNPSRALRLENRSETKIHYKKRESNGAPIASLGFSFDNLRNSMVTVKPI